MRLKAGWLLGVAGLCCVTAGAEALPPLHAEGCDIRDDAGNLVALRGANLGGGLLYEAWLVETREPAAELALWRLLGERFGPERLAELQRVWRQSWTGEDDIAACAAMGMTCVRLPFGYWLLEDLDRPGQWREEGFAELERIVSACERHGLYVILDLHGAAGGQSAEHHCGVVGSNALWTSEANQQRTVDLWREIARRYAGRAGVAGYDLLNEPMGVPDVPTLVAFYGRLISAIREVDPDHLIILEDGYKGFEGFPRPADAGWSNVAFSPHIYSFGRTTALEFEDLIGLMRAGREMQREAGVPIVVGEFGAVSMANGGTDLYRRLIREMSAAGWGWQMWCWKHPCRGPSEDLWGIANTPRAESWAPPDFAGAGYEDLLTSFGGFALEHWGTSPLVRPVIEEGLAAEVTGAR
jgi:endoglucanase